MTCARSPSTAPGSSRAPTAAATGCPPAIKLPVRLRSRLVAGRRAGTTCRRARARTAASGASAARDSTPRRACASDARALLRGRLTDRRQGRRAPARCEVWRQLLGSHEWKQLRGSAPRGRGRFRYRARRGPARTIRFRYPGTREDPRRQRAGRAARARLDAASRASRRLVVNGEYVDLPRPAARRLDPRRRTLVELQVYTRGAWRTFAQPRTRRSGRWRYQYRFETIRGRAAFRFRARIRRQADYPFTTGTLAHRSASACADFDHAAAQLHPSPRLSCEQGCVHQRRSDRP